jgi:deazaflavin-dependent oxidoreductase (nitroreductase family)
MPLFGQEHVARYRETGGEDGHDWQGTKTLLLTTTGARQHPGWYLNLEANPEVEVQVGDQRFTATARTATPEEKPELWKIMTAEWPAYDEYQTKTDRDIPVVVLTPR